MEVGTCKYFNGSWHNECCLAGVNYDSVTTEPDNKNGRALRLPCHNRPFPNSTPLQFEHFNRRGKCDKYEDPSPEDITKHKQEIKRVIERMNATMPLIIQIKREHKGESWKGIETCPICGGKLHMTHAAINGHVWGQCETKDCVSWME
jgi:hypothetical protein